MPVLGAVLLFDSPESLARARQRLQPDPRITLGEAVDERLPVVLESVDRAEDRALWDLVGSLEGLALAHPVYADFSDLSPATQGAAS